LPKTTRVFRAVTPKASWMMYWKKLSAARPIVERSGLGDETLQSLYVLVIEERVESLRVKRNA
jgi:hypothetical protein